MAGRRAKLIGLLLLAVTGCRQAESLRQGILSTYTQELRQLATDINSKELAKIAVKEDPSEAAEAPPENGVRQAQHWHAAPLTGAVQLNPPVPLTGPVP